ncbi:MAG: hypothetical protein EHM45_18105 [Desulfobacteraceae bacterium]|nr:MAG: hypothetical protein EHM45_18105 [Desulfobacteraceae bacterium]
MKKQLLIMTVCICALIGALSQADNAESGSGGIVFKNVNIIPMNEETVLKNCSVFVAKGKIEVIGKFEDLKIPESTKIIDAENKYLVPGFSDMHVHIEHADERILFLANGVTLVRNMWGSVSLLKEIEEIHKKRLPCPEIYTTGPLIDGKGAYWRGSFIIEDPNKVAPAIKQMKADGFNAIKVYDKLSKEVYMEIIKTAKEINIPVMGHVPIAVGLKTVIHSGQKSIEHFNGYPAFDYYIDNDLVDLTVKSGIWNCPTLVVFYKFKDMDKLQRQTIEEIKYVNRDLVKKWKYATGYNPPMNRYKKLLKVLFDNGARIVAGTDTGNPFVIAGFSLHEELQYMNEAGLTPYQVLLTTTKNAAEMLGYERRLGTIEKGKDADLVLLDKNPLEDIKNTKTIAGVMVKGVWLPKELLQSMLAEVAERNK